MRRWISATRLWIVASVVLGLVSPSPTQALDDRTVVRVNGTTALTRTLFPAVAAQEKMGDVSINRQGVASGGFDVLGFGATYSTYVTDVSLKVPVAADSLSSSFKSAPANKGEIDTNYRFKDAKLRLTFHVKTSPKTPLDAFVPDIVKQRTSISDSFGITVTGVDGELDLTLKKSGDFVAVDSVDKFTVQVDAVTVKDSARLLDVAEAVVGLGHLFNVTGVSSVNQAATKLANALLKEELDLRKELRGAMNDSLKRLTQMGFGTQAFPVGRQGSLTVSGALHALQTSTGRAVTEWNIDVQGQPSGAVPKLAYAPLARPPQDVGQLAAQGDVEVFAPYSLMDKAMYELVQMGSLDKITVPRSSASGISVGFDMKVEPTEVPRVKPVANARDVLVVEFAARMADTQVGTVKTDTLVPGRTTPKGPTPVPDPRKSMIPESIPVILTNASARVAIQFRVRGTNLGGLYLQYVGMSLDQLTGSLTAAATTAPLTNLKTPLQNAIDAHLRQVMPRVTLIQQALQVVPGVSVRIGEPRLGVRYVGLPLTIAK